MPNYAVSLGAIAQTVKLEAENPQQAMNNVIATMPAQYILMIPREDVKDSHWFSRNVENGSDEVVVTSTEEARRIVSRVRKDVVDVFWFVSLHEERNNSRFRKAKKNR